VSQPPPPIVRLEAEALEALVASTVGHYQDHAENFWQGTKDHDVSQNRQALLRHLGDGGPHRILDLGCGPGRDLQAFVAAGHTPTGLDACAAFVEMAQRHAGCDVYHQDMLALDLPEGQFDGVFANAVLFHVPSQELPRVLSDLHRSLVPEGVLFSSNPRGPDVEDMNGRRYGCYLTPDSWSRHLEHAGFRLLERYFRPPGRPRQEQPWLATVWRRG
jgi:SAM-dependent methyltransferase